MKEFVNLEHARTSEQKAVMKKIKEAGVCPFCPEHFQKYHSKKILRESKWWTLTENMSPYEGSRVHLIFVYKQHITMLSEISEEGLKNLFDLTNKAIKEYKIVGGTLLFRFGDTNYTGGSVGHLHAQLITGGPANSTKEGIRVKIGYST